MYQLATRTPLIRSHPLSRLLNKNVFLKLDLLQPSGSFKDRGLSKVIQNYISNGVKHFISSSGGNAGLSAAVCCRILKYPCRVVVPKTATPLAIRRIRAQDAVVTVHGRNWNEADELAQRMIEDSDTPIGYIHPFANPISWDGHSSVIDEIVDDWKYLRTEDPELPENPDAMVCSVGGGGLLNGICIGLDRHDLTNKVDLITAETIGADSLYQSVRNGELITLEEITSIATTLGIRRVNDQALNHLRKRKFICERVSDEWAVKTIADFLYDHRMLVEPACAASLALVYNPAYRDPFAAYKNIVIVLCGGSGVDHESLMDLVQQYARF